MAGATLTALVRAMVCSPAKTARVFSNVLRIAAIMAGARARDVTAMQVGPVRRAMFRSQLVPTTAQATATAHLITYACAIPVIAA
jgi:hypothetical protein